LRNVTLDPRARGLIDRVFDYTHRVAHQIMTLRRDVTVLRADRSFDENLEVVLQNQFTRYPLVDPDDRVLGYVHLKDLSAALATGRRSVDMRELAREPVYASSDAGLEDLRREFQSRNVHLAVVRDAAQGFVGIVTLEDLLEELVGEIRDEQDSSERPPIVRRERGGFEADGRITLDVAERELGLRVANGQAVAESLSDFMVRRLGAPPTPGASIEVGNFRLTVIELRDQRVWRLRGEGGPDRRRTSRD
jgi:CBS domain containing-hemolysin-like protein